VVQIAIVVAILGAGVLVTVLTSDVTRVSEPGVRLVDEQPFLPDKAADWTGGELQGLSESERKLLPADTEGARRSYTDKAGNEVFCSIVLAGREVTSIHRPELCLPGQGWKIENEYTESIPAAAADGGRLKVMRMNMTRAVNSTDGSALPVRCVFVYWFVGKGRVTPYHWQRILWTAKDRVLYNTNHRWAYILIYAPVRKEQMGSDPAQSAAETMQLITRFVQVIYPALVSSQTE
jgi:EpsI family protein